MVYLRLGRCTDFFRPAVSEINSVGSLPPILRQNTKVYLLNFILLCILSVTAYKLADFPLYFIRKCVML